MIMKFLINDNYPFNGGLCTWLAVSGAPNKEAIILNSLTVSNRIKVPHSFVPRGAYGLLVLAMIKLYYIVVLHSKHM